MLKSGTHVMEKAQVFGARESMICSIWASEAKTKACAMSSPQCDTLKSMKNRSLQFIKTKFTKFMDWKTKKEKFHLMPISGKNPYHTR